MSAGKERVEDEKKKGSTTTEGRRGCERRLLSHSFTPRVAVILGGTKIFLRGLVASFTHNFVHVPASSYICLVLCMPASRQKQRSFAPK